MNWIFLFLSFTSNRFGWRESLPEARRAGRRPPQSALPGANLARPALRPAPPRRMVPIHHQQQVSIAIRSPFRHRFFSFSSPMKPFPLPPPPPTFVFAHWLLDVPKRKEPIVIGCFFEILFYDKLGERFPKLSNPYKFMETSNQRRRSLFIFIFSFHIFIEFSFSLSLSLCSFSINIFSILSKIFFREREREVEIWTKAGTERMFRLSFLFFDKGGRIGSLFFYFLPFFSFSFLPATYLRPPRSFGTMGSCVD